MEAKTVQINPPAPAQAVVEKPQSAAVKKDAGALSQIAAALGKAPPASKGAAAKDAVKAKVAANKATPAKTVAKVEFVPRYAVAGKPVYAIADAGVAGSRPTGGTRLYAHTHAALTMLGLFQPKAKAVPKKVVLSVIGSTAVGYHTREGNIEDSPAGVKLTAQGREKFLKRSIDTKLANGFLGVFLDGKVGDTGIKPEHVYKIA